MGEDDLDKVQEKFYGNNWKSEDKEIRTSLGQRGHGCEEY